MSDIVCEPPAIVIDNGSFRIKVGFAGDESPRSTFRSCIARHDRKNAERSNDVYVGDEVYPLRYGTSANYPIKQGIITDWDDMEKIWHYTFYDQLRVPPEEQPLLMTENIDNPSINREKTMQSVFEMFSVPAFYTTSQSVLSLFGSGRTTGLVLDIGGDVTHIVPIYQASKGMEICHAALRVDLAGRELTNFFMKLMAERGYPSTTTEDQNIMRYIKEMFCFTALDFNQKMSEPEEHYTHIEPNIMPYYVFGNEAFRCPEALFSPALMGLEMPGIHELVYQTIMKCDVDMHKDLFANVVLSGGSSKFRYTADRLKKELSALAPQTKVHVLGSSTPEYLAWEGGSILASLSIFNECCITKDEYNECGPAIVHRKCFSSSPSRYIHNKSSHAIYGPLPPLPAI